MHDLCLYPLILSSSHHLIISEQTGPDRSDRVRQGSSMRLLLEYLWSIFGVSLDYQWIAIACHCIILVCPQGTRHKAQGAHHKNSTGDRRHRIISWISISCTPHRGRYGGMYVCTSFRTTEADTNRYAMYAIGLSHPNNCAVLSHRSFFVHTMYHTYVCTFFAFAQPYSWVG